MKTEEEKEWEMRLTSIEGDRGGKKIVKKWIKLLKKKERERERLTGKGWKGGNEDWDKILSKCTVCRVIKIVWKRDEADFKNLKKKN